MLKLENVKKTYDGKDILKDINLEIGNGEIVSILGPSGSGKTTLLNIIGGLDKYTSGDLVINGIDVTEERQAKYDFSNTYAYASSYLIVKGDNEDIKSLEDLNGKKLTNSPGSSYALLGEQYGASNVGGDTFADTINNLVNGYADASINSADTYGLYIKEHPDADVKVVMTIDPLDVAIPFVKGEYNKEFLDAVNSVIDELKASGELSSLSIKFFGTDITVK